MKYIINERQYKLLVEEEQEILHIPSLELFNNDWETLQKFLEKRGNPLYSIGGFLDLENLHNLTSLGNLTSVGGSLYLRETNIESLGNLTSVGGTLYLSRTKIKSLGNLTSVGEGLDLNRCIYLTSLGNLTSVGYGLDLKKTNIESLGNLTSVGGTVYLENTPASKKYSEKEIRQMVDIGGNIYL